LNHLIATGKK